MSSLPTPDKLAKGWQTRSQIVQGTPSRQWRIGKPNRAAPSHDHGDADPSNPDLSQLVVLDPQWLANMLSRVVTQYARHRDDSGTPIPCGQVPLSDVALAWHGYPDELRGSFLEVLFALEVAFPGMGEDGGVSDTIIVPALLQAVVVTAMLSSRKTSVAPVGALCAAMGVLLRGGCFVCCDGRVVNGVPGWFVM